MIRPEDDPEARLREHTRAEQADEMIRLMLRDDMPHALVAECARLPLEKIRRIAAGPAGEDGLP